MGTYDDIMKHLGRLRGEDFIHWFYPNLKISEENISFEDREFEKITSHKRLDLLYLIKKENEEKFYLLLEFETGNYSDYEFRFLEYFTTVWRTLKAPIKPVTIFLNNTPTIKRNPNHLQCKIREEVICEFNYTKIILPEEYWKEILKKGLAALLPLIPISQIPKEEEEEALRRTIEEIEKIPNEEHRAEVAGAFYIISGLKRDRVIEKMIGEKLMKELMQSETYKKVFKTGEEVAGKKYVINVLKARKKEISSEVQKNLNLIKDLEELDFLVEKAATVNSSEEFKTILNELIKKHEK